MGLRPKQVYCARQLHPRAVEFLLGLKSEPAQTRPIAIPCFNTSRDVTEGKFSVGLKLPTPPNSQILSNPHKTIRFLSQIEKPTHKTSSMAEHGGNEGGGEVVDQTEDRGGMMEHETGDQAVVEAVEITDAAAMSGGDGEQEQQQKVGDDENRRASEVGPRAIEHATAVGSISEPVGTHTEARASPAVGGSSGVVENSGTNGDETEPNGSPPRDSAKGKGVVIEEEHVEEAQIEREQTTETAPIEIREEDIAFRPPAGAATSSRHMPITYNDIAEHTPDEILARVLESHPEIGEYVLKAKEDRERAIEEAKAAARAEREAERERAAPEGQAADIEAEEAEAEEALGPRVSAVAEAEAIKRPVFSAEAYIPPRPHLFVPSVFAGYKPPQIDYSDELVLRDPGVHVANTWTKGAHLARPLGVRAHRELQDQARDAAVERRAAAERQKGKKVRVKRPKSRPVIGRPPELLWKVDVVDSQGNTTEVELVPALREPAAVTVQVPIEWVNEALRRMLALENLVRRAAQGMPLTLRYPAPAAQSAQAATPRRTQAQGRAASKKRARSPPQQAATETTTRPVVTRRQTGSSQPKAANKEVAKKAGARAEERYRIEVRDRSGQGEPARKKQLVLVQPPEEEEEEEREEEDEEARSDSDDTVDDPQYLQNPHELAVDEDDTWCIAR
ncbi:hypothetical protein RHMOL_Rhmol03G0017400 [Rhododendron molle]|uniref:Uncharacterized protein n=1 Tax=Rhododendron molle TaxID=49168 RepID=A0ACC0P9V8_RHOML|nr:hypothetical protein RHMOL_Rhmol03G0017400 [Rhododendron molle]